VSASESSPTEPTRTALSLAYAINPPRAPWSAKLPGDGSLRAKIAEAEPLETMDVAR
jgi:hypothetical protein